MRCHSPKHTDFKLFTENNLRVCVCVCCFFHLFFVVEIMSEDVLHGRCSMCILLFVFVLTSYLCAILKRSQLGERLFIIYPKRSCNFLLPYLPLLLLPTFFLFSVLPFQALDHIFFNLILNNLPLLHPHRTIFGIQFIHSFPSC